MDGPAVTAIKRQLTFPSNDGNRHEGTNTIYVEVMNHVLRRYATGTVIARAYEKIRNFKQRTITLWVFSQTSWDPPLQCDSVFNQQML